MVGSPTMVSIRLLSEWMPRVASSMDPTEIEYARGMSYNRKPPADLLALDGRKLAELTAAELAILKRYRNGRRRGVLGLPWISVGFQCSMAFDPWAWLHASREAERDALLRQSDAIVCIHVYD